MFIVYYVEDADLYDFFSFRFFVQIWLFYLKITAKSSLITIFVLFLVFFDDIHQAIVLFTVVMTGVFFLVGLEAA